MIRGVSRERLLAQFLSVCDPVTSRTLYTDVSGSQIPLMVVVWWLLDVRKGCGSGSDTTHSVRILSALVMLLPHSRGPLSCSSIEFANGDAMRHPGKFWFLPRTRR